MGTQVEILRSGRQDSAIKEEEIEAVLGERFGFHIERNADGGVLRMRKKSLHEDLVLVYEPPATLWTKDPDKDALQLMIEIAGALRKGARVRNDEYKTYLTAEQTYIHPDDADYFKLDVDTSATPLRALDWRKQLAKAPGVILLLVLFYIAGRMLVARHPLF